MLREARLAKQMLFIAFAALLALAANLPYIITAQHWPLGNSILTILLGWAIIGVLMYLDWRVIDRKDEEIWKMEDAKYQEQLKKQLEVLREETRTAFRQTIDEAIKNRDQHRDQP